MPLNKIGSHESVQIDKLIDRKFDEAQGIYRVWWYFPQFSHLTTEEQRITLQEKPDDISNQAIQLRTISNRLKSRAAW